MLVPKAAVYKDHTSSRAENNIRLAGQVRRVQSKAVPKRVKKLAYR